MIVDGAFSPLLHLLLLLDDLVKLFLILFLPLVTFFPLPFVVDGAVVVVIIVVVVVALFILFWSGSRDPILKREVDLIYVNHCVSICLCFVQFAEPSEFGHLGVDPDYYLYDFVYFTESVNARDKANF